MEKWLMGWELWGFWRVEGLDKETGVREQGTGNREQGTGNRGQGTGNREEQATARATARG
jgi:hypothetical protein